MLDLDDAYRIGLIAETLTDAGPQGLTLPELQAQTQLDEPELVRFLGIAVEREFVRRVGQLYRVRSRHPAG